MATVGDRLRQRRLELGLSHRGLACEGVSAAYLSRIEANMRQPSVKVLRKLAARLSVSVHWLETGEADPAELLALLVLEHHGKPLPRKAGTIARAVLARR